MFSASQVWIVSTGKPGLFSTAANFLALVKLVTFCGLCDSNTPQNIMAAGQTLDILDAKIPTKSRKKKGEQNLMDKHDLMANDHCFPMSHLQINS